MSEFKVVSVSQDTRWPEHVVVTVQTDLEVDDVIRLVDTAPDLLAALEGALLALNSYEWIPHPGGADGAQSFNLARTNVRAAIARAKGKSQ